jgi:2-methylisocitrate lyase-like PEP mutase family enzyme
VLDHAGSLELSQPLGEQAARQAGQATGQVVETRCPHQHVAQDQQRPAVTEQVEGGRIRGCSTGPVTATSHVASCCSSQVNAVVRHSSVATSGENGVGASGATGSNLRRWPPLRRRDIGRRRIESSEVAGSRQEHELEPRRRVPHMSQASSDAVAKAQRLRELHLDPAILSLVNVWDVVSAQTVAAQPGTTALATASEPIAAAHGYRDGEAIPFDLMLATVARICAAVPLPVTADLEAGYGDVDRTIRSAVAVGVVGANIEDQLRPLPEAAALMAAAVRAAEAEGVPLVLNARTDTYLYGDPATMLTEAIERGKTYLDVGADCVFVLGCSDLVALAAIVEALGRGRVSALWRSGGPTPQQLEAVGVARVSHGPYAQRLLMAELGAAVARVAGGSALYESAADGSAADGSARHGSAGG